MRVKICIGSACHLKGSREIVTQMQQLVKDYQIEDQVNLNGAFCNGDCAKGVCVTVDEELYSLKPEDTKDFFEKEILQKLSCDGAR